MAVESKPAAESAPLAEGTFCPDCGYDLRGSTSERCPECGFALERLRTTESQIPWVHRRQLGFFRAYWRTAWQVTFHCRRFCAEASHPISHADAQRFLWANVILAYVAILLIKLAYRLGVHDAFEPIRTVEWLAIPIELGTLLTLAAWTSLPTYLFHPRKLPLAIQNRAVALSYYACGPLVLLPLALVPIGLMCILLVLQYLAHSIAPRDDSFAVPIGLAFGGLSLVLWWLNLVRIAHRVLRRTPRTMAIGIFVPVLWAVSGTLIQVGLPALTFYVVLVFYSLS